ncbi:unnamed protein product [Urochloa decumbens]|uniref:Uncharacterized protein n=1 Tax=Urochloa decumbens TaxID=240449 RepID=A0ABC9ANH7_9POAL
MMFNKKLVVAVFTLTLIVISCGAEAPPGYDKEKKGWDICFSDWICKAFWRLGLPRGGGLHERLLRQEDRTGRVASKGPPHAYA